MPGMTSTLQLGGVAPFLQKLQDRPRHGVNAGVPAADDGNGPAPGGKLDRLFAALDLPRHARRDDLLSGGQPSEELDIRAVADDRVGGADRRRCGRRQVLGARPARCRRYRSCPFSLLLRRPGERGALRRWRRSRCPSSLSGRRACRPRRPGWRPAPRRRAPPSPSSAASEGVTPATPFSSPGGNVMRPRPFLSAKARSPGSLRLLVDSRDGPDGEEGELCSSRVSAYGRLDLAPPPSRCCSRCPRRGSSAAG